MAAMVNMNSLLNGKDSRWLQLEVCREFQRNKCSRQDTECKFAHPPANVEVQNGKVTACYDSIKGRCNRDKPPCKYFHPPQHLKDQLLINGRNHLALKNALMQQMGIGPGQPVIPGQVPAVASNPYLTGIPANTYSPYFAPGHLVPALLGPDPSAVSQLGPVVPQAVQVAQQKIPRSDRLETAPVSVSAATLTHPMSTPGATHPHPPPPNAVAAAIGHPLEVGKKRAAESDLFQLMDVKTVGSFYYENFAFSGMVPYKRPAAEKSGIPVYQPGATTYQQLMQLQQPPFVPVSCEYQSQNPTTTSTTTTTATTSAATANPQPQTSITTTTSTTSATTLANLTNLYAANNNLQLNFTQSPNFSTALISQNHYTNNLVDSSGNNAAATTTTIATSNNHASNVNSNNKINNSLYNYSNNNNNNIINNNSNNNNNILSFVNNNNSSNSCSLKSATTATTSISKNPFATAITSNGNSNSNNNKNLLNGTSEPDLTNATNNSTALNGSASTSTDCTNNNNNTSTNASSTNNAMGDTATLSTTPSAACSPHTQSYQNDSDAETNEIQDKKDFSSILIHQQQQQHILQHDSSSAITTTSSSSTLPYNGTTATTISDVPLPNGESSTTALTGVGILPTPLSTPAPSHTAPPTSTSVVTNAYQAQQNMQRLYNAHSLYQSGATSYANVLVSHGSYTPSTNTMAGPHYTSQALTVPSPYGTIVSAAGTPAYSYASAPHHYVQSTAVSNPGASYYHDAASLAKEVAQKNYANAVKMAAASSALSGKPLTAATALNYTGMSLNKTYLATPTQASAAAAHAAMAMAAATNPHHHAALMQAHQQQAQAQAQQVQAAQQHAVQAHAAAAAAAQMRSMGSLPGSGMSTPVGTPVHTPSATPSLLQRPGSAYMQAAASTMLRPQPIQLATASQSASAANSYAAAAQAAANQQYVAMQQQQSFFYPGMMASAGYPYAAMSTVQAMQGLPTMAQMAAQAPPTASSAVVLNPYKKMKTS